MILAKEQRIAALILFSIALSVWIGVAVYQGQQEEPEPPVAPNTADRPKKKYRTWEERKDSMRRVDSIRFAQWTSERQQRYDSFRIADSLWRDSVGMRFPKRVKKDTVLDLNHCDTTELQYIRGIGHYTAIQIVRYREQLGGYYSPSQLTDKPFANMQLDTLLDHFTADPADVQTIDVNSIPLQVLQRHPYLRYEQAKSIYTLRRQRVQLHTMDELRTLPELKEEDIERIAPYLRFE